MVATMASPMPTAAQVFPLRAVSGWLSIFSPKMKSTEAITYMISRMESPRVKFSSLVMLMISFIAA
jgi:hypothetical protein